MEIRSLRLFKKPGKKGIDSHGQFFSSAPAPRHTDVICGVTNISKVSQKWFWVEAVYHRAVIGFWILEQKQRWDSGQMKEHGKYGTHRTFNRAKKWSFSTEVFMSIFLFCSSTICFVPPVGIVILNADFHLCVTGFIPAKPFKDQTSWSP